MKHVGRLLAGWMGAVVICNIIYYLYGYIFKKELDPSIMIFIAVISMIVIMVLWRRKVEPLFEKPKDEKNEPTAFL